MRRTAGCLALALAVLAARPVWRQEAATTPPEAEPGAEIPSAQAAAGEAAQPAGDAIAGKALFLGTRRLTNGGPACRACHSVAGIGALGGGALGPDLTGAYGKFGQEGTAAILAGLPFPTMTPIFGDRPLTPPEQADLLAFFSQAVPGRSARSIVTLTGLAVAGAVFLLLPIHLTWRRRLSGVRRRLLERGGRG